MVALGLIRVGSQGTRRSVRLVFAWETKHAPCVGSWKICQNAARARQCGTAAESTSETTARSTKISMFRWRRWSWRASMRRVRGEETAGGGGRRSRQGQGGGEGPPEGHGALTTHCPPARPLRAHHGVALIALSNVIGTAASIREARHERRKHHDS